MHAVLHQEQQQRQQRDEQHRREQQRRQQERAEQQRGGSSQQPDCDVVQLIRGLTMLALSAVVNDWPVFAKLEQLLLSTLH